MIIDIIFLILVAAAVFKGLSKGFIVAVFSLIALVVGLAAAMKLSYLVTAWLQPAAGAQSSWLPFVSFLIVLLAVSFLVRMVAGIIQRVVKMAMLGWLNKLAGIAFFFILYVCIYSVVLFYLSQMNVISPAVIAQSHTYGFIEPFGHRSVDAVSALMPVFKNSFTQLSDFFSHITQKHV